MKFKLPYRGQIRTHDAYGGGGWGASRGPRIHRGVDVEAAPGETAVSPCDGVVHRIGWVDATYRLVEIFSEGKKILFRILYISPTVEAGEPVSVGSPIGVVQDLTKKYPKNRKHSGPITNHIHFEARLMPKKGFLVGKGKVSQRKVWIDPTLLV